MNLLPKNILSRLFSQSDKTEGAKYTNQQTREKELVINLIQRQRSLYRKDIERWRQAHSSALNISRPDRVRLYDIYDDCMLDAHLSAVIESRILRILNTQFEIVDDKGERDDEATAMIRKRWALRFNRFALESKFYGYSLVRLHKLESEITDVSLIPREHVVPELGGVRPDVSGDDIIPYVNPPENIWYIGIGEPSDLGILLKAAPLCIYKKNALGHWSKFQEIYGIPPRIAKTGSRDKAVQNEIVKWLDEMGSSAYGLFPEGTEFEILEASGTDAYQIWDKAVDRINSEISKLILLQTMTTDNGSSRSQSEVHQQKEDELIEADLVALEYEWNDKLMPVLIQHGYKLEGKRFSFDRTKQLYPQEQWKIVNEMLTQGYNIPDDFIRKTFYVPVDGREKPAAPATVPPANQKKDDPKAHFISLQDEIEAIYNSHHSGCQHEV